MSEHTNILPLRLVKDGFPWLSHRTIREVAETEWLRVLALAGVDRSHHTWARLIELELKAVEPERYEPETAA